MADQQPNLDSLFLAAVAIESADEQAAFLDASCGTDGELRRQVEQLLQSNAEAGSFLDGPAPELEATGVHLAAESNLAAVLQAGLSPAFDKDQAIAIGNANHSVLRSLSQSIDVPRVMLRNAAEIGDGPIVRLQSSEMPDSDSFSRYRLDGEIARGGMGAILKGRDTDLGRDLAIKVLLDAHKNKPEVVQRFIEEAQIGGQLQHPGIAPVYELGQFPDRRPFFSMKLVKGETLAKLLSDREEHTADRGRFIGIFEQICQTMAYAHSRGVIHRDLKPANIMVGAFGEVQVMDWGLAKVLCVGGVADERKSRLKQQGQSIIQTLRSTGSDAPGTFGTLGSQTQMGSVMGTPAYMPPEQALGEIDLLDERADVFGLGAILCEILTSKPPYVSDDGTQIFRLASRGKLGECFERLDACGADAELITLTKHCLELEPSDRPRDAGVLAERVSAYLVSVDTKLRETEMERAAQAARLEQQQASARKLQKMIVGLAVVAVVAGFACVAALIANNNANRLAHRADQEAAKAKENAETAKRSQQETADALTIVQSQKKEVEDSLSKAEAAEQAARAAEEQGRKLLYTTDMRLAPFLWSDDRTTAEQLRTLLAKHNPDSEAPANSEPLGNDKKSDLRGFEWHYYQHLLDNSAAVLSGHRASVTDSAFTADGQLVTLDQNGQVRRWHLNSQDEDEAFRRDLPNGSSAQVRTLSPDGRMAALGQRSKIHVFDTSTGNENFQVVSAANTRRRLKFSPDSRMFVIVDDQIRWYDARNAQLIASFDRKFNTVGSLALSADGLTLAVVGHGSLGGSFSTFRLDPSTHKVTPLTNDVEWGGTLGAVALSPNGRLIAVGEKFSVSVLVYETASGRLINQHRSTHASHISAIAFADDGTRLVTADVKGTIKIWEHAQKLTSNSAPSLTLKGHAAAIISVGFTSDGKRLVSTSADKTIRLWDTENAGMAFRQLERSGFVARFSPDGHLIASAEGSSVRLWDAATGQLVRELSAGDESLVYSMAFSPTDSRLLAVGYGDQPDISHVELWDIDAGVELARLPGATDLPNFRLDAATGAVGALAFAPDGKSLVAGFGSPHFLTSISAPSPLKVWDVATRRPIRLLEGHTGFCVSLDFSRDGTLLASGSRDGTAIIWSTETWKATQTLSNRDPEPRSGRRQKPMVDDVAFSPDGKTLAMASLQGNVLLWDVGTGNLLETLQGHSSAVLVVAFSPDGRTLASGGSDQTVRLWNVETRTELMQLDSGNFKLGQVDNLMFSPDGMQLLAGGQPLGVWSSAPNVWNDSDRAAKTLKLWLDSNADFRSRIRMFSENIRLYAALEKLDSKDQRVPAALAATRAHWHASRQEWQEAAAEFDRLVDADPNEPAAWLRTPGLLRLATALLHEGRPVDAASLLTGGEKRRIEDGFPIPMARRSAFGFHFTSAATRAEVLELAPGSPAARSNLRPGDIILKVNDVELTVQTIPEFKSRPAVDAGTRIRLAVRHPANGQSEEIELESEEFAVDYKTGGQLYPLIAAVGERLEQEPHNAGLRELRAEIARQWSGHDSRIADYTAAIEVLAKLPQEEAAKDLARLYRRRGDTHAALRNWPQARDEYAQIITDKTTDEALLANQALAQAEVILTMSAPASSEYVWVDDAVPPEAKLRGNTRWEFVRQPSHPVFSGETSVRRQAQGLSQHFFHSASPGLNIGEEDTLFAYVFLDPQNPPKTVMLQFNDGDWGHRAFWGDDLIPWGVAGTQSHLSMGPLPKAGEWVRLEVEAKKVGLGSGTALNGWGFTQHDGTCYWDRAGIVTRRPQGLRAFETPWQKLAFAYRLTNNQKAIDELVERRPQVAGSIGDVFAERKEWQRAIEIYSKGITAETTDAALLANRAQAFIATQQWDRARADWRLAIDRQPDLIQHAFDDFRTAARWSEAAEFGLQLVNQKPNESPVWLSVAPLLVVARDETVYADFCHRMVRQFSGSKLPEDAHRTVKASLLRVNAIDLAELPSKKFIVPLEKGTVPAWFPVWAWNTRALLAYRSGDAESAVKYAAKSEDHKSLVLPHLLNVSVLALSHHQLQHPHEARRALEEALQLVTHLQKIPDYNGNQDLLIAQILIREAEAVINGKPEPKPTSDQPAPQPSPKKGNAAALHK